VTVAVAQETSRVYVADAAIVDPKYKLLDGAQARYADAKAAQKAAFEGLQQRLKRIADTLNCVVDDDVREHLSDCWEEVLSDTISDQAVVDCEQIDQLDCDALPDDLGTLQTLIATARACATRANTAFDDLAGLPARLAPTIAGLVGKANALEQEVCGPRTDPERSFVEYLQLKHLFEALDQDWISPTAYGCRLKNAFVTLLHRHVVLICLTADVFRRNKWQELADKAKQAKTDNLIDLVLECARPKPTQPSPGGAASTGTVPAPPATPQPAPGQAA